MVYDFHMHTFLSDGVLLPCELIRRAIVRGYTALAITDHAGRSMMQQVIEETARDCALVRKHWGFPALPGVELTHIPASSVAELATEAKELGAVVIVVHGETPVEPVEPGTNLAAVQCPDVDILGHPGLLTEEEARQAAANEVCLELTARKGHNLGNGRVARIARDCGARLIVDSDTHEPGDLLTEERARLVALGAGLSEAEAHEALVTNPQWLLAIAEERYRARWG